MFKFTFIVIFSVVFAIAFADPGHDPEMDAAVEGCKKKYPSVPEDTIKSMCTAGFKTDNEDVKCFAKCMGETLKIVDESGKLNKEAALKKPPPFVDVAKLPAAIDECATKTGSSPCDTVYQQMQCLHEKAPK